MTRVSFNGRFLGRPVTGVERFAGEIIRAIDALCAQGHSATHGMDFEIVRPPGEGSDARFPRIPERVVGTRHGHLWEQLDLPHHARGGILVNLCNTAPLFRTLNVTCVHDANVFLIPGSYAWLFRVGSRILLPLVIRRSRRWVTVSAYSATQLARLGVSDRPPSAIVGNGTEHMGRLQPNRSRIAQIELPRPFIFALGSRSPNKNIELLLSISEPLRTAGLSIVLAGGTNARVFSKSGAVRHPSVLEFGRVEDEDLAFLYSQAFCFAFPSFYEGFGIPALEAMASGCPVIAADSSALPEVLGDAALLCSPTDPQAWQSAIARLASEPDLRTGLVQRGRERARLHSWREAALRLLDVVRTLA